MPQTLFNILIFLGFHLGEHFDITHNIHHAGLRRGLFLTRLAARSVVEVTCPGG